MNLGDLPVFEQNIDVFKKDLEKFCTENNISRFEPEDILELLEEREDINWIVEQLQQDNAELDSEKFTSLLTSIQSIVAPPKDEEEEPEEDLIEEQAEEIEFEEAGPPMDLSQLDISQVGDQIEAITGMKLPPGVDMHQVKKIMEGPQGKMMGDFAEWCQEQGIDMASMTDQKKVQELNEQWMSTSRPAFDGKTPAEMSEGEPSLMSMKKVETYRREQPRIGRNDPCPCGSGKKYKKCCGKGK